MKKCPKCQEKYSDDLEKCLDCDMTLEEYQDPKQVMLTTILEKYKKEVVIIALIISFILGFGFKSCIGIKKSDYEALLAEKDRIESLYNTKTKDFDYYKSLMQPYEEQQKNDAKIAEEKKLAEEKAKKEAEEKAAAEKAAQETEAKRQADEEAKAGTLGVTPQDFVTQFNSNCAVLGFGLVATAPTTFDSFTQLTTSNDSVSLNLSITKSGYVSAVFINYTNQGTDDGIFAAYATCAAAQVFDSATDSNTFADLFNNMVKSATPGQDYVQSLNGIEYRFNYEGSSAAFMISKR